MIFATKCGAGSHSGVVTKACTCPEPLIQIKSNYGLEWMKGGEGDFSLVMAEKVLMSV
jgi:hypothetical protein